MPTWFPHGLVQLGQFVRLNLPRWGPPRAQVEPTWSHMGYPSGTCFEPADIPTWGPHSLYGLAEVVPTWVPYEFT